MKKISFALMLVCFFASQGIAQKIIPIEYKGQKYEVLDMTSKGKITWGGYNEEVAGEAAKSESNGAGKNKTICPFFGKK